jgi:oligopeptidase A
MTNPLLESTLTDVLPMFDQIKAEHFLPAITAVIKNCENGLEALIAKNNAVSWDTLFYPLESLYDPINRCWAIISHLNGVTNTDAIRDAHKACLPLITAFNTRVSQHPKLYAATQQLRNSHAYNQLDSAQRKIINNWLRDFKLAGVDLPAAKQQRYAEIKSSLAALTTRFSNNVLDATQAYTLHVEDSRQLAGIPDITLHAASARAAQKKLSGYLFTLDMPSYLPLMQYCDSAELRQQMYRAFVTRASDLNPKETEFDNSEPMQEIIRLRTELALLLGFSNYAELSLATKMANNQQQVINFLRDLASKSRNSAKQQYAELAEFAQQQLGINDLQAWDVPYASEKMRLAKYAISQEDLRPYFPADTVITGMFDIVNRLYGIKIIADEAATSWHEDVRFYTLYDANNNIQAQFYLDLFTREGKRGGAWMADCKNRRITAGGDRQIPVAFLVCNFSAPIDEDVSLLTHNEVVTLFHEFGHGLHHMLTQVNYAEVSGINGVAWDAVELPSQFLENWCWEAQGLALISGHYKSGEKLPEALLQKMLAAKNFQSAMQMVRQLEFALFDFIIHSNASVDSESKISKTLSEVRAEVAAYPVPEFNRFEHSFSHIFAGGYAAGYYSYKWAEVLSADAFSLFEERGVFDRKTGLEFYREILAKGGSDDAQTLFENFRGREASITALLRHSGIAINSA